MAEPVTLTEAKAQCRMENDTSEDTFITSLIAPARAYVERATRRFWVAASRTETFTTLGDYLEIYRAPIASVDGFTYGADGTGTSYTGFQANLSAFPVRIYPALAGDFDDLLDDGQSAIVTFTSGALDATSEEYLIGKRAMLLLIGHWYEFREAAQAGIVSNEIAFAITSLLDDLRPVSAY